MEAIEIRRIIVEINLEPRYKNYWLDLARKDQKNISKEEQKRQDTLKGIVRLINQIHGIP